MKRLVLALPLVAIVGCNGGAADEEKTPDPVALVRVARAELGSSSEQVTVYGAAEVGSGAERTLVVPAEAIVARIDAPTGTPVHAGQAMVTLRPSRTTTVDIAKAASDAATSQAAYQRAVRLRGDGLVSDADVETARAAAATAVATSAGLGMARGGLVLRAPVPGTVQALTAKTGDQLAGGTTIATIVTGGNLRARFGVDPALVPRIRIGQPIAVDTIGGDTRVTLSVVGVDPQVDPVTRLASVYALISPAIRISTGQPLRAEISVGASRAGITIPYAALLDDGGRSFVFVVRNRIAKSTDVTPGNTLGDRVQILKGLNANDMVVTQGGTALEDGMKVRFAPIAEGR